MSATAAPRFDDGGERAALGLALAAHVALFAFLSLAWGRQAPRAWPKPEPMEVSLVADVAPEATAPPSPQPPALSVAPEQGQPEEAPPPAPQPEPRPQPKPEPAKPAPAQPKAEPQPAPKPQAQPKPKPAPALKRAPAPKSAPVAKPAPAKPAAPAKAPAAAKPIAAKAAPASRASRLAGLEKDLAAGSKPDAKPARPRGHRLGDTFLAGLAADAPAQKASAAAPAAKAGPFPTASIQQAIARQIQPCADRQVNPGPGANAIVTVLNVRLNRDGTLAATPRMVRQSGVDGGNERYAQRVVDLGIAAFKGCTPLKLPAEYYDTGGAGWNNINYRWQLR